MVGGGNNKSYAYVPVRNYTGTRTLTGGNISVAQSRTLLCCMSNRSFLEQGQCWRYSLPDKAAQATSHVRDSKLVFYIK